MKQTQLYSVCTVLYNMLNIWEIHPSIFYTRLIHWSGWVGVHPGQVYILQIIRLKFPQSSDKQLSSASTVSGGLRDQMSGFLSPNV